MLHITPDQLPSIKVGDESEEGTELFKPRESLESTSVEVESDNTSLYEKIHNLTKDPDGIETTFIPENSLKVLFKDANAGLKVDVVDHLGQDTKLVEDVVTFICEKAPKVYATLVYSMAPHLIVRFLENKLDDALLPVVRKETGLTSFAAQARLDLAEEALKRANLKASELQKIAIANLSDTKISRLHEEAKAAAEDAQHAANKAREAFKVATGKVKLTFSGWRLQDRNNFCETHQWTFMAPVFKEAQFSYKFHEKTKMPFWPSDFTPKTGNFSSVTRRQIDRNHLPQNDVSHLSGCTNLRSTMAGT